MSKPASAKLITGLSAFPITPQSADGRVDEEALGSLLQPLIEAGCDSIGLLGSTGTYAYLSREERRRAIATARAAIDASRKTSPKHPKLLVGIGHVRTSEVIKLAQDALEAGADVGLLSPVSYAPLMEREVHNLFLTVATAVPDLPLVIYSNESTTRFTFTIALEAGIANSAPSVVGAKNPSRGTVPAEAAAAFAEIAPTRVPDFTLGYSVDSSAPEALMAGGEAWFSVLAGIFPKPCVEVVAAINAGDHARARAIHTSLQPLWRLMAPLSSVRVAHTAISLLGVCEALPPPPLLPLEGADRQAVADALEQCKAAGHTR